jgi:hypothetical protein
MSSKDWKAAFGPTPEAFKQKISFTLQKVEEGKPVKKIKAATVAAIALVILFLAAVAYAAATQWGLFSFLEYRYGVKMPPEAQSALNTNIPQTGGEKDADVTFKVREALYDGVQLHLIVEARSRDPQKILLMSFSASPDDAIASSGPVYQGDTRTYLQVAAQEGKRLMDAVVGVKVNGDPVISEYDSLAEEDGTMVIHMSGPLAADAQTIRLDCHYTLTEWKDGHTPLTDQIVRGQFSCDLPVSASRTQEQYSGPVAIDQTGVTVDKIVLTKTDAGVYAELTFSLTPEATEAEIAQARDGLWFEYLDEQGRRIEAGTTAEGGIDGLTLPDGTKSDTSFVQTESLNLTALPGSVTVRGYNYMEKTRFGQYTFTADK